jgi:hypothetical protein
MNVFLAQSKGNGESIFQQETSKRIYAVMMLKQPPKLGFSHPVSSKFLAFHCANCK